MKQAGAMWKPLWNLVAVFLLTIVVPSKAFTQQLPSSSTTTRCHFSGTTALYSTPPRRQPRRNLQKRRKKSKKEGVMIPAQEVPPSEIRPLVAANAKEAGEDYWIDPEELKRSQERQAQIRARDPGQIPDKKLWNEVLAPYRNNWIGFISVTIVVFAFIFKNFPEVIDPPLITNIPLDL